MRRAPIRKSITILASTALVLGALADLAHAQQGWTASRYRAPVRDASHVFQRRVWSWKELREKNIVMQKRDFSCGAAALATLVQYYWGDEATEQQFLVALDSILTPEEIPERIENGLTLTDLRKAADKAGYNASIGRLSFQQLSEAKVPLVVGITVEGYDHFVVYRGTDGRRVYLADPIRGNIREPVPVFLRQWQENAVLVVAKPGEKIRETSPLQVRRSEVCVGWTNEEVVRNHAATRPLQLP